MNSRTHKSFFQILGEYKLSFIVWFFLIFTVVFSGLYLLGLIPEEIAPLSQKEPTETLFTEGLTEMLVRGEEPVRIKIPSIKLNSSIENPTDPDIAVLDEALKRGVVRYPGSGLAGEDNLFLFGHSTSFKVVNNPAYKVFNNLKTLKEGDTIIVESKEKEYIYKVTKVTLTDAETALVDLSTKKKMLTLSTCNTFGAKQERYVVEADFIDSYELPNY